MIEGLSDQEKSVMLARAMGWHIRANSPTYYYGTSLVDAENNAIIDIYRLYEDTSLSEAIPDLYDPANMALAWRVLNWAMQQEQWFKSAYLSDHISWELDGLLIHHLPPVDAQRAWLDKILELAIEAGIVEVER